MPDAAATLFDFAVVTIFAREFLEGAIILGEYRTILQRGGPGLLEPGVTVYHASGVVHRAAWVATAVALIVIAAVAIPLAVLSATFDDSTSKVIEGLSKMVAAVCLLQLSLKLPKFLGVYGSCKQAAKHLTQTLSVPDEEQGHIRKATASFSREDSSVGGETQTDAETPFPDEDNVTSDGDSEIAVIVPPTDTGTDTGSASCDLPTQEGDDVSATHNTEAASPATAQLTMKAVRFNVAWNIWREVAECGVFLIPFFLSGEDLQAIPLSAVVGSAVGCLMGWAIYVANRRLRDTRLLAFFIALLLLVLSAGLWTGGAHNLELQWYTTRTLWSLKGDFWSIDRLPMTVLKPFGYNDSRTIMETCTYWSWLGLGVFLHVRKYKRAPKRLSRPRATLLTQAHPATTEDAP